MTLSGWLIIGLIYFCKLLEILSLPVTICICLIIDNIINFIFGNWYRVKAILEGLFI